MSKSLLEQAREAYNKIVETGEIHMPYLKYLLEHAMDKGMNELLILEGEVHFIENSVGQLDAKDWVSCQKLYDIILANAEVEDAEA